MVTLKSNKNISGMEEITGFISYSQIKDGFLIIELNSSIGSFIIEVDLNTLKDNKDSLEVNLPDIQNTLSRMIEDKQPVKFKNGYLLPLKKWSDLHYEIRNASPYIKRAGFFINFMLH